ncbi:PTS sugar transporter subunit IIA [Gemella cuniculi]|uniref:PTS sugar transporter subunit IIA n=1 Tax=Gemella cuniculi TaxID=150240 RepID=UPI000484F725|nr:PTS sugar transporter subunit IIA [Gemella cuniculi]
MAKIMKFKVYKNNKRTHIEDIYKDIAEFLEENSWIISKQIFLKDLEARENLGCIKVDTNFYLPHLENNNIIENIIIRVDNFKNDILFILIKDNDTDAKNKAKNIVKNLLVEDKRKIILQSDRVKFEKISEYI